MQCEKRTKINKKEAGFSPFFIRMKIVGISETSTEWKPVFKSVLSVSLCLLLRVNKVSCNKKIFSGHSSLQPNIMTVVGFEPINPRKKTGRLISHPWTLLEHIHHSESRIRRRRRRRRRWRRCCRCCCCRIRRRQLICLSSFLRWRLPACLHTSFHNNNINNSLVARIKVPEKFAWHGFFLNANVESSLVLFLSLSLSLSLFGACCSLSHTQSLHSPTHIHLLTRTYPPLSLTFAHTLPIFLFPSDIHITQMLASSLARTLR